MATSSRAERAPASARGLGRRAFAAIGFSFIASTAAKLLTMVSTFVLARLLTGLTPSALGTVLVTLPSRSLAQVLSGLQPGVQSRILGELPTSVLSQLAPSAAVGCAPERVVAGPRSTPARTR